jgi:hypothetical protein
MTSTTTTSTTPTTTSISSDPPVEDAAAGAATQQQLAGILAMEVYTPACFVQQRALEEHMGVGAGKFTIGLGQEGLAITGDAEDINSICLTAVANLLEKYVCANCGPALDNRNYSLTSF